MRSQISLDNVSTPKCLDIVQIIVCQIFSSKPSLPFQPSPQPLAEQEYLGEFSSIMVKKSFPFPFSRAVQPLGNITLIQIQKQQYKSHDCVVGEVKLNSMSPAPEPILIIMIIMIIKFFAIIMIIMILMTNRSSPTLGQLLHQALLPSCPSCLLPAIGNIAVVYHRDYFAAFFIISVACNRYIQYP